MIIKYISFSHIAKHWLNVSSLFCENGNTIPEFHKRGLFKQVHETRQGLFHKFHCKLPVRQIWTKIASQPSSTVKTQISKSLCSHFRWHGQPFKGSNSVIFSYALFLNIAQLLKKRICSCRSKFFPSIVDALSSNHETWSFIKIQKKKKKKHGGLPILL